MNPRRLLMSESAWHLIREAASLSHPSEAGGILIGVRAEQALWITQAIEINPSTRDQSSYLLPRGATRRLVKAARAVDSRLGYLGDWHSHPADVPTSTTDHATLLRTAMRDREQTVLLVARQRETDYYPEVHQSRGDAIERCKVTFVGDLPEQQERNRE